MSKQTYGITGLGLACIVLCNALLLIVECCFWVIPFEMSQMSKKFPGDRLQIS